MTNKWNTYLIGALMVCLCVISLPARALTEQDADPQAQAQKRLTGTWALVEAPEIRADGSRADTFGANPKGLLVIDDTGRYSLQIYKSNRSKYSSGDVKKATEDELRAAALSHSTHFGRCFIDVEKNVLVFRIEQAANVNWNGTEQSRQFELKGDMLSYRVPATANSSGTTTISVWKKIH